MSLEQIQTIDKIDIILLEFIKSSEYNQEYNFKENDVNNNIELKPISELLGIKFFIPSYQRGYRWTSQQVEDLLNDVNEFAKSKKNDYEFYCIQPLVVKEMSDEDKQKNNLTGDKWHEVIDGQQRLTTIRIILTALKNAIEILGLPTKQYDIVYQRKNDGIDMEDFLENIENKASESENYIDYYFMYNAFLTVNKWIKETQINKGDFCNALLKSDYDNSASKKIRRTMCVLSGMKQQMKIQYKFSDA